MIWIAVDAMGGDTAPGLVVQGALAAARHLDLGVVLVGPVSRIEDQVERHAGVDGARVRLVEAGLVIDMAESPTAAVRRKPNASIKIAADLVARGEASDLFSAGHPGAYGMAAHGAV